jgi:hypothetical protein
MDAFLFPHMSPHDRRQQIGWTDREGAIRRWATKIKCQGKTPTPQPLTPQPAAWRERPALALPAAGGGVVSLHRESLAILRALNTSRARMTVESVRKVPGVVNTDDKSVRARINELIQAGFAERPTRKGGLGVTEKGRAFLN